MQNKVEVAKALVGVLTVNWWSFDSPVSFMVLLPTCRPVTGNISVSVEGQRSPPARWHHVSHGDPPASSSAREQFHLPALIICF